MTMRASIPDTDRIRACPYCGTLDALPRQLDNEDWAVICQNVHCAASGPRCHGSYEAIFRWNVRITTEEGEPL